MLNGNGLCCTNVWFVKLLLGKGLDKYGGTVHDPIISTIAQKQLLDTKN
jgi:hypothetical protein